ncbi:MAG TPA: UvrD-helicase domain-containing protein [Mycobacteriales bacterium]|nr:UvrD-helicase domain-containing protein [Mycobacteriales bacterium]
MTVELVRDATFPHPPLIGPAELAAALGLHPPTAEQEAVIAAPLAPAVVVAGAGSGKTETMSARVVWLVANGYVRPDEVLGLTFTNKAAAELAGRIRIRLAQLARNGLSTDTDGEPTVLTYHAYAGRLAAEHALRLAVEPTSRLLTGALSWQLAARVVRRYDGELPSLDVAESTVLGYLLDLAGELAEHLVGEADLRAWTAAFRDRVEGLPAGPRYKQPSAKMRAILAAADARCELLPLVAAYQRAKREATAMDFGDQMSLAARIAVGFGEVGRAERARYRAVLLDEFQDTGHSQLVLLRALFGGAVDGCSHPVTAVGDPCQSIYGWRGASAGNLTRFPAHFPASDGAPAAVLPLSTSFRNDRRILAAANLLSTELRAAGLGSAGSGAARSGGAGSGGAGRAGEQRAEVGVLTPGPAAGDGRVRAALLPTVADEAAWLADRIAALWTADAPRRARPYAGRGGSSGSPAGGRGGEPSGGRSIAVLCRRRSQFQRVAAELRARGVPVELVGLGGLLATPEVRDVVSTLRVLSDPSAGDAVVRLLTGARWRLGPRDLAALGRRARELAHARPGHPAGPGSTAGTPEPDVRPAPDVADDASLVEALDDPGPAASYSPAGHRRLLALRRELAGLRRRVGQPLPELVAEVERALLLDIEVGIRGSAGRVHLDRFLDVAARFAEDAEVATLGAFLGYLEAAESTERGLEAGVVEVNADRVQVLTVHAAKGLEWDVVAVPGLTLGVFPDRDAVTGSGWAADPAALPYPLRGDADDLPDLDPAAADDQAELEQLRVDFVRACKDRGEREERRLAYVAVTRARRLLLCSGYWWDDATKPRGPSPFLTELRPVAEVDTWADPPGPEETNPLLVVRREAPWPYDPLGGRRADVDVGAELVRAALAGLAEAGAGRPAPVEAAEPTLAPAPAPAPAPDDGALLAREEVTAAGWRREADLLLAERAARVATGGRVDVPLPAHLSVSALVALAADAAELARRIRRPMPFRPAPMARRGTAFHAWLEERYGGERLLDLAELPGAADDEAAPDTDLELLQERFLASEWADRSPVEVEVPFEAVLGGLVVRGRMDAVFAEPDGGFTVVDWKTGARPTGAAARAAAVQLAAYRLAWAALAGVPLDQVRAAFHYVRSGVTVRPVDLLDAAGLRALTEQLPAAPDQPQQVTTRRPATT